MLLQFFNQYFFVVLPLSLMLAWASLLKVKQPSRKWWLAWGSTSVMLIVSFFWVLAPPVVVVGEESYSFSDAPRWQDGMPSQWDRLGNEFGFNQTAESSGLLTVSKHSPVLLYFYSEFGFG